MDLEQLAPNLRRSDAVIGNDAARIDVVETQTMQLVTEDLRLAISR